MIAMKSFEKEIWCDVPGFESRYLVSTYGRVFSKRRNNRYRNGLFLKTQIDRYGYEKVTLFKSGIANYYTVHRLVALTFLKRTSEEKIQVNHINGIKTDNDVRNLEWCSQQENIMHSFEMKLQPRIPKTVYAKHIFTNDTYSFFSQGECARHLDLDQANIYRCLSGFQKTHKGYVFSYNKEDL